LRSGKAGDKLTRDDYRNLAIDRKRIKSLLDPVKRKALSLAEKAQAVADRNPTPKPQTNPAESKQAAEFKAFQDFCQYDTDGYVAELVPHVAPDNVTERLSCGPGLQSIRIADYVVKRAIVEDIVSCLRVPISASPSLSQNELECLARQHTANVLALARNSPKVGGKNYDSYSDLGPNHMLIYATTSLAYAANEVIAAHAAALVDVRAGRSNLLSVLPGAAMALAAAIGLTALSATSAAAYVGLSIVAIFGVSDVRSLASRVHEWFVNSFSFQTSHNTIAVKAPQHLFNNYDCLVQSVRGQELLAVLPIPFQTCPTVGVYHPPVFTTCQQTSSKQTMATQPFSAPNPYDHSSTSSLSSGPCYPVQSSTAPCQTKEPQSDLFSPEFCLPDGQIPSRDQLAFMECMHSC